MSENTNSTKSSKWLYGVLLITLLATYWVSTQEEPIDEEDTLALVTIDPIKAKKKIRKNNKKTKSSSSVVVSESLLPWQSLDRHTSTKNIANVFEKHSWKVIAPVKKVVRKPLPKPKPTAPAVPFKYMGKYDEGTEESKIFLMQNDRFHYVSEGDVVGQWRIDKEENTLIRLTYLPLNQQKVLSKAMR